MKIARKIASNNTWISFSTLSTLQSSQIRLCFRTDLYLPVSIAIGKIPQS